MKKILITALFLSILLNVGLIWYTAQQTVSAYQESQEKQKALGVLKFQNLFLEKVVLADNEIDFDTRLNLENAVRALNNPEILARWEAFVKTKTREEASVMAERLLGVLVKQTAVLAN